MLDRINHGSSWGLNRLGQTAKQGPETISTPSFDADWVNRRVAEAWGLHPGEGRVDRVGGLLRGCGVVARGLPPKCAEGEWHLLRKPMTFSK
jgi:hypothetical protein